MVRKIPETFKKHGFLFKLIKRVPAFANVPPFAIYSAETRQYFSHYEIHRIRIKPPDGVKITQPDGKSITINLPEREALAKTCEFGRFAWSAANVEQAERFLKEEQKKIAKRATKRK